MFIGNSNTLSSVVFSRGGFFGFGLDRLVELGAFVRQVLQDRRLAELGALLVERNELQLVEDQGLTSSMALPPIFCQQLEGPAYI